MATNNYRITGDYYVSKAGNDSNDGLTPATAKATFNAGLNLITSANKTLVVGAGVYEEAVNKTINTATYANCTIKGDGIVVFLGNGSNSFSISFYTAAIQNFYFVGYSQLYFNGTSSITYCIIKNIPNVFVGQGLTKNLTFINCSSTTPHQFIQSSIFVNTTCKAVSFLNCYVNLYSQLTLTASPPASTNNYNNLMGQIRVNTDPYYYLADHKTNYPTLNVNSFSSSPLFNDSTKEDFTLQATSPHLNAASDGTNIGGTNYGKSFASTVAAEWQTANGAIWENITQSGFDLAISAGQTMGRITSAPMMISTNPVIVNKINYMGQLLFNKSKAGGSDTNQNVPDANLYAGSDTSGGGNPDHLTFEMRWVNQDSAPASDAEWKNGYLLPAGSFGKFLWNQQPVVDNSQRGNGEPDYATAIQNNVVAVWVQIRVTLRNNYL